MSYEKTALAKVKNVFIVAVPGYADLENIETANDITAAAVTVPLMT
jgi:hypothetical protein